MIDFKLSSFLSFCLLDTRFGSSSRLTRYASSDHGLFNPSSFEHLISKEKNERPKFGEDSFFFPFFTNVGAATNFYLGLSGHSVFIYERGCVSRLRNVAGFRLFFTREPWYHGGCVYIYIYVCVFSLFSLSLSLFGILRPRENNVSAPREKLFFEDWVTARITWTIYAHHVANSFQGEGGVSIFVRRDTHRPAPAFSRPIRSNNCGKRWDKRVISFFIRIFYSVCFEEIRFSTGILLILALAVHGVCPLKVISQVSSNFTRKLCV